MMILAPFRVSIDSFGRGFRPKKGRHKKPFLCPAGMEIGRKIRIGFVADLELGHSFGLRRGIGLEVSQVDGFGNGGTHAGLFSDCCVASKFVVSTLLRAFLTLERFNDVHWRSGFV